MPTWLRWAVAITTPINLFGAVLLSPLVPSLGALLGFPEGPGLYQAMVGWFVFLFAIAYGWMAWTGVPQRAVLALGVGGKSGFAVLTAYYAVVGAVPPFVGLAGAPDLVLAGMFATYLWQTREG